MKKILFLAPILLMLCLNVAGAGTFVSGSTGADGACNPTIPQTELQLPPNGVFNFTTVNIPVGVTVTFKKNAANTPVYILATGDVTIAGTIDVSGASTYSSTDNQPGLGGPGGFDGGYGGVLGISGGIAGNGLGPGGGNVSTDISHPSGGGGGFGTVGQDGSSTATGGPTYGNARLIPLIGGSGGGGMTYFAPGAGGGGAILIASSGNIKFNSGNIYAPGGMGRPNGYYLMSGGGSGEAIKLMANIISGIGFLFAEGSQSNSQQIGAGGSGRIRLEAFTNLFGTTSSPNYTYGLPGPVFVANIPSLSITFVGGATIPSNPTASYSTPDIALPNTTTNPVTVTLSASNIPVGTTVTVSAIPQFGTAANVATTLNGTNASSTATASVNLSTDYASVIMAYTTYTLQTAMYYDGEKINKVRVASSLGGKSEAVYLTESGKEIKAKELILAGLLK